ncbi:MAG: FAD-dependent monooxygenase [Acidobacteriota bacterium]
MLDVLIAGAGPAGAIAARDLALAGARVLLVDRETFPRDKLCGDTLNPGALQLLASRGLSGGPLATAQPLAGWRVTGPGSSVDAWYDGGRVGVSLSRRVLDQWLVEQAVQAGARFEPGLTVQGALIDEARGETTVRGLVLRSASGTITRMPALVTIGADGRRSAVARSVGLGRHPPRPRRWAFGTYFTGADGCGQARTGALGEMHIRPHWYCGIAPMADGRLNVCVVTDQREGADDPEALIRRYLASDRLLRDRFAHAECVAPVMVLGPLAVDVTTAGVPGLLLAGDAAGFVDPVTGDGVNLAMQGAVLAADGARRVLESGDWTGVVARLNSRRREVLGPKLRFNRALRVLTSSTAAVRMAGLGALVAPGVLRRIIVRAGDAA